MFNNIKEINKNYIYNKNSLNLNPVYMKYNK